MWLNYGKIVKIVHYPTHFSFFFFIHSYGEIVMRNVNK